MAYSTIPKGSLYMNTKLYTGNGSTNNITGVGFQPDWVWIKNRGSANHYLFDVVRGVQKNIHSNENYAEVTEATTLTAFGSDGFTLSTDADLNGNGASVVSWNWKAGTAVSGNTGGGGTYKTYTGSVNATAGFSIIKYTGNGTAGHTIPHHLGAVPKMIITKRLDSTTDWMTYHSFLANTQKVALNSSGAVSTSGSVWNSTTPTNSVFAVGTSADTNNNNSNIIAYCFAEKQGYSKFGSYTGNGNADGTFVYTGFKPAFVLIKATSATGYWTMHDNKRTNSFNVVDGNLYAQINSSEDTGANAHMDFLSNGFKLRGDYAAQNGSGTNNIFMAFAEQPLVGDNPATAR